MIIHNPSPVRILNLKPSDHKLNLALILSITQTYETQPLNLILTG